MTALSDGSGDVSALSSGCRLCGPYGPSSEQIDDVFSLEAVVAELAPVLEETLAGL